MSGTRYTVEQVLRTRPQLFRTPYGWLAVSRPGEILSIGVIGNSKKEADERFADAVRAWANLHKR